MYGPGHKGFSPSGFELVVLVASHGGLAACTEVVGRLPGDFPACVVVVQHLRAGMEDRFRETLAQRCSMEVAVAESGVRLQGGLVYVAPATDQVLVSPDRTLVTEPQGPPARCLGDPLLESAGRSLGAGVIAVVLTGRLRDGSHGVTAVKTYGGRVLVQEPGTAAAADMPIAAIATGCADFVLPLATIAASLVTLVMAPGAAAMFSVPLPHWASVATGP